MRNSRTHILFVLEIAQGHPSEFFRLYHFPGGSDGKESDCNSGGPGSVPGSRKLPCRRKWQATPVFLPGKAHGQRNLVGYSPWSQKVMDTIERLPFHFTSPQWVFQTRPLVFPWSGLHCSSPPEAPLSVIGRDIRSPIRSWQFKLPSNLKHLWSSLLQAQAVLPRPWLPDAWGILFTDQIISV